jgi:hypothetical protein
MITSAHYPSPANDSVFPAMSYRDPADWITALERRHSHSSRGFTVEPVYKPLCLIHQFYHGRLSSEEFCALVRNWCAVEEQGLSNDDSQQESEYETR